MILLVFRCANIVIQISRYVNSSKASNTFKVRLTNMHSVHNVPSNIFVNYENEYLS